MASPPCFTPTSSWPTELLVTSIVSRSLRNPSRGLFTNTFVASLCNSGSHRLRKVQAAAAAGDGNAREGSIGVLERPWKTSDARLVLEDGSIWKAKSFGALGTQVGEVVFNTSLTGYQEILTDPSYAGQFVLMTNPHIGNTGVNPDDEESSQCFLAGLVVRSLSICTSNWRCTESLGDYLAKRNIMGIYDVDTRAITRRLRQDGSFIGVLSTEESQTDEALLELARKWKIVGIDLISGVSCNAPYEWQEKTGAEWEFNGERSSSKDFHIVAYDFGIKHNILRRLASKGCKITVVPSRWPASETLKMKPDGVLFSNGPGDPSAVPYAVETVKEIISKVPIFGICMGHQLLGQALGGKTFKMKFGHHGGNHPVCNLRNGRVEISAQNHNYAVDSASLPAGIEVTHINLNDNSCAGLSCPELKLMSLQYHPEASPGPHDSDSDQNVKKGAPETLVSPRNPTTPTEVINLSNIDQTVAFPVETIFFYEAPLDGRATISDFIDRVKTSVSEVLLVPYYFMAGRLHFNFQTHRLDLVCNNAGASFVSAATSLRLEDLGDLSLPNPSFQHLIVRVDEFEGLGQTPLFTIQVTRFRCGGLSIGFMTNHCLLDGRSAAEMFENLAAICRGEGVKTQVLNVDRSCIRARDPPQIKYQHAEYIKLADVSSLSSSFTLPSQSNPLPCLKLTEKHKYRLFSFSSSMIKSLKEKAMMKCSTFEAIVAHLWKARTRAVFDSPLEVCSLLFAVDIRTKMSPPLPEGFTGNAVITASASAKVVDLAEKPISFGVEMVRQAIERVTDDYVRSAIDWLEVHRGMPSTMNGSFYVSAWWKLPFHELDFGWGKPLYGGPVVSGMDEFVLLLSDGNGMGKEGGINVWISLDEGRMEKFIDFVFDL